MATGFLALLDDIVTVLDDIAVMSKMAAKKSVGILGDDLALNAEQVVGVTAERELPVVMSVAKGSLINKIILIPFALSVSAWTPWIIQPLLILGGAYLCFEGAEKILHKLMPRHFSSEDVAKEELLNRLKNPSINIIEEEKQKIKGAIRTDFILSAEIVVLTLGMVAETTFLNQVAVLVIIGLAMTFGVYGLVAALVKIDDLGLYLTRKGGSAIKKTGYFLIYSAPWLMKLLGIAGTAAMFLVGGGIFVHGFKGLHDLQEWALKGGGSLGAMAFEGLVGLSAGLAVFLVIRFFSAIMTLIKNR